jgi:polyphosphate kinase
VPGVSENIRVHALVDRFLEHARIFHFSNAGQDDVYCSSADWMPRNFRRRVEVMFPISDATLKTRVIDEILGTMRADTSKGWTLQASGSYQRLCADDGTATRSQQRFMELARERAREAEPLLGLGPKPLAPLSSPRTTLEKLRRRKRKKPKRRRSDDD